MKKVFLLLFVFLLAGGGVAFYFTKIANTGLKIPAPSVDAKKDQENTSGNNDSTTGSENTGETASSTVPVSDLIDQIRVTSVSGNQEVSSPVVIQGQARGNWFFEEKFLVQVTDEAGKVLGRTNAQAKGDVTPEEFIPFIATVDFPTPSGVTGYIVLQKMTALGTVETGMSLKVPVYFAQKVPEKVSGGCKITGCSQQICSDSDISTTCEYREEYICYQKATCQRQVDGNCGWTQTPELEACLDQFNQGE